MSFNTLTVVVDGGTGVATGTPVARTAGETAIDILAAPFGVTALDTEYVQKSFASYSTLVWGVAAGFVGEAFGNKRGRLNKNSFLPLFRG